jgi:hypothetical protein
MSQAMPVNSTPPTETTFGSFERMAHVSRGYGLVLTGIGNPSSANGRPDR